MPVTTSYACVHCSSHGKVVTHDAYVTCPVTLSYTCGCCGLKHPTHVMLCPNKPTDTVNSVDHPAHYGGADNPYEAIKVIEAWSLGFCLGNAVKYICRAGKKHKAGVPRDDRKAKLEDLKKARWYVDREISRLEAGDAVEGK